MARYKHRFHYHQEKVKNKQNQLTQFNINCHSNNNYKKLNFKLYSITMYIQNNDNHFKIKNKTNHASNKKKIFNHSTISYCI